MPSSASVLRSFCAVLVLVSSQSTLAQGPPVANVRVGVIEMRPVVGTVDVTGQVRPWQWARVASREPGRVLEVAIRAGDEVEAGGLLGRLDDSLLRPAVAAGEAALASAKATLAERDAEVERAERDVERLTALRQRDSATQNEYDDAQTALARMSARREEAAAAIARAEAELQRLRTRLDDMTIRAPFAGRVVARRSEVGEWIGEGGVFVELVRLDPVEVWLDVPERYAASLISRTPKVTIIAPALGREFQAASIEVVPMGAEAARTFPVRIRVDNPEKALLPGMSVTARAPTGESAPAMVAPSDALLRDDAGWFVYTATGDDSGRAAVPARVEIALRMGEQTAIRPISGPVFPGALVVVEGNERILFPGQPLAIVNPEVIPAAPAGGAHGAPGDSAGQGPEGAAR